MSNQSEATELTAGQGLRVTTDEPDRFAAAIECAIDYRGDVTLGCSDGRRIEGFLFDRKVDRDTDAAHLRLLTPDNGERVSIELSEVDSIEFTGKDTAEGRSWEKWVQRYVKSKLSEQGEESTQKER